MSGRRGTREAGKWDEWGKGPGKQESGMSWGRDQGSRKVEGEG